MEKVHDTENSVIASILREGKRGSVHRGKLQLGTRATGADIAISYIVVLGAEAGPTLWINGQVHGTEVCGIVAGMEFCRNLDPASLKGSVVFTASANPLALESRTWATQQDFGQNLDTLFPGRSNGFITERMAACLMAEILAVRPALLLSMHAQGTDFESQIYGVYKLPPNCVVEPSYLYRLLRVFNPFAICHQSVLPGSGEHPGNHAGALDYLALVNGIPAFMVEFGVAQRATPEEVQLGIACYRNICVELGMLERSDTAAFITKSRLVNARGHLNVDVGGIWQSPLKSGAVVKAGDPIGTITDFTGVVLATVTLPMDILLIALRLDPVVHTGDSVAYIASEWSELTFG
ncbi:M14 family metallopeptidase [Kineobactrum salinum]|uniref:Peptidase M14 n=1 Tax=Kineobactrum salinum TaxID=2708301 RepID=A0A6C0TZ55_9GAMM|nr:M14 family metallopeptidase [Kineobactrum salinum]QIB65102.1 peptidase M14 [Kineobactrum salinum]